MLVYYLEASSTDAQDVLTLLSYIANSMYYCPYQATFVNELVTFEDSNGVGAETREENRVV